MKFLTIISNGLARIEAVVLSLCLLSMLAVAFFQVVMRNIYGVGYIWADIFVRTLVIWVGLLGASLATHEVRHLTIDAITKFLPTRVKRIVRVIVYLFALIVCIFLTKAAVNYLQLPSESHGIFGLPPWAQEVIIPVAFILISFHLFVLIVQSIADIFRHTDASAPPQDAI